MSSRERYVVARLASGLVIRGTTIDFTADRPGLRVTPEGSDRGVEVKIRDLKALFFPYPEGKTAADAARLPAPRQSYRSGPDPARDGKRVVVRFQDGETMTGHTLSYRPEKVGFYLFPDDPESQHEKVFIVTAATSEILLGDEAANHPVIVRNPLKPKQAA